ncbi:hypothetical protein M405DRAFT_835858 [Rhizopogon salebrosus TDB-379]|nr:hypothetical protein M405DRAFT_835858 [Rhizopogon salebrosus TDB-379]
MPLSERVVVDASTVHIRHPEIKVNFSCCKKIQQRSFNIEMPCSLNDTENVSIVCAC